MAAKKEKHNAGAKKSKIGRNIAIFIVFLSCVLIVTIKAAYILIIFGCLPTIVAYYADKTEDKMEVATIACCNLCGVMPYVAEMASKGKSLSLMSHYVSNPNVWLTMYGAAAVGYGLIKFCPMMYRKSLKLINSSIVYQLEQQQEKLVRDWGDDIRDL
jgi:hypothetical protein